MPLSTSLGDRRGAPDTHAASAYAATTNDASRTKLPGAGMALAPRRPGGPLGLVLRRALGHHAIGSDRKPVRSEMAFDDDFGSVLERVGHHAGVARVHNLSVALYLEDVVQRVGASHDRLVH